MKAPKARNHRADGQKPRQSKFEQGLQQDIVHFQTKEARRSALSGPMSRPHCVKGMLQPESPVHHAPAKGVVHGPMIKHRRGETEGLEEVRDAGQIFKTGAVHDGNKGSGHHQSDKDHPLVESPSCERHNAQNNQQEPPRGACIGQVNRAQCQRRNQARTQMKSKSQLDADNAPRGQGKHHLQPKRNGMYVSAEHAHYVRLSRINKSCPQ